MNVLVLTLFVSFGLVAFLLLGFVSSVKRGDIEHNDRLSMLPLEDDIFIEPPSPDIPSSDNPSSDEEDVRGSRPK